MHPEWAKLCSEASAGESDFAACFSDNVAQMLYSKNEIQRQAFEFIVNANGMRAELVAFKACVPAQYRSLASGLRRLGHSRLGLDRFRCRRHEVGETVADLVHVP